MVSVLNWKLLNKSHIVLGMTLNCSGVPLDNRKVFCTPSPQTKPFERIFYVVQ